MACSVYVFFCGVLVYWLGGLPGCMGLLFVGLMAWWPAGLLVYLSADVLAWWCVGLLFFLVYLCICSLLVCCSVGVGGVLVYRVWFICPCAYDWLCGLLVYWCGGVLFFVYGACFLV